MTERRILSTQEQHTADTADAVAVLRQAPEDPSGTVVPAAPALASSPAPQNRSARSAQRTPSPPAPLIFDVCQAGAVLRTVLFVEAVAAVGVLYKARGFADWTAGWALVTLGALPATLMWLVAGCACKRLIARLSWAGQYVAGTLLGAAAGLVACALLALLAMRPVPWLAGMCSGAVLAASIVASLAWRVRGRTPAGTTARLAELQSRIRPHFLFNTLNSAIALVREDPDKAETILEDLADLFHHALSDQGAPSTVGQEIELARRYLEIEQVRFGERLRIVWSLDQRAEAASLPPLILQPLVENAVKHGVEPSSTGAQLRVSTRRRGQMAVITVTNTVPAGHGKAGHGIALRNVRQRLRLLHDLHGQLRCKRDGDAFQARIEVPMPDH
jgi:two-component system sensor histidine kinase AlgZ